MNMNLNTGLIPRTTLTEMVGTWKECEAELRQAFALLVGVEAKLKSTFKPDSYLFDLSRDRREFHDYEKPDGAVKTLKKDVWRALIDRMELRRVMSVKDADTLDKQLESGEGLPKIEVDQIMGMLDGMAQQMDGFMTKAVRETFDYLRPHRNSAAVTNHRFQQELGLRAAVRAVESCYTRGFRVSHYHQANIRAMDNVFHMLDGKGTVKTHRGPLMDAIEASPNGVAETEYFAVKCFRNGNLHIRFKKPELVAKINAIVGGNIIKETNR